MNTLNDTTPFYKRLCYNLISITLIVLLFYFGQGILVPFFFAILVASLLLPVNRLMERKGFHHITAIILSVTITFAIVGSILWFLAHQIANFVDDLAIIDQRLDKLMDIAQKWVRESFGITIRKQNQYIRDSTSGSGSVFIQQSFGTLTDIISYMVLLPIYSFLILYYRGRIRNFFVNVFSTSKEGGVDDILQESLAVSQRYIIGLVIELVIVFALNATGFLIIGIKYALFLALISAILNLIPYMGMLIANLFCMLITLISGESVSLSNVFWVCIVLAVVQFIDNNFLMPLVVGSKVRINAMATLIGVLVGGALCGVPGMFLSIPGLALMKVIFDRVDGLQPFGMLLGDESRSTKVKKLLT